MTASGGCVSFPESRQGLTPVEYWCRVLILDDASPRLAPDRPKLMRGQSLDAWL